MKALNEILNVLQFKKQQLKYRTDYFVPSLWVNHNSKPESLKVDPFDFFISKINQIINKQKKYQIKDTNALLTYNLFVRFATAFDHNQDGSLSKKTGFFKETGTFLKSIALLEYLEFLGVNTIYLLPITSIGIDRKKGNLGSPYAIRDPYKIDENLSEDILEISIETQYKAFVEACHHLGFNVINEFVFRTASVDSDLALEHPEWFYWIDSKIEDRPAGSLKEDLFGPPIYNDKELIEIKDKIEKGIRVELPEPHEIYLNMYHEKPEMVSRIKNKVIGYLGEQELRIPGAFADWPPDDTQPVWSDVTYLKLFEHPDFNYMAYNTVRMYDEKLNKIKYRINELWDFISGIIPYYINNFEIDGVMIDMGHALPAELRAEISEKARKSKPEFIFWEENFIMNENSVKEGYDAVLGYMPFDAHEPWKMKELIKYISSGTCPINFFATAESHNTPRAASRNGGENFNKAAYVIAAFMQAMPFIHNGYELGESNPVNTGLGFQKEDYNKFPPDKLALFSTAKINWLSPNNLIDFIHKINQIRNKISPNNGIKSRNIFLLHSDSDKLVTFILRNNLLKKEFLIAVNLSDENFFSNIDLLGLVKSAKDLYNNKNLEIKQDVLTQHFDSFGFLIAELYFTK